MENKSQYMTKYICARHAKLKIRALEYKGNKCIKCGYSKCPAALTFHHRDPSDKELDWKYLRKRSWDFIIMEIDKCDLLCANCHAEVHWDDKILRENLKWLEEVKRKPAIDHGYGKCKQCGINFKKNHDNRRGKFCSPDCVAKYQTRVEYPPDNEFIKLVDELGQSEMGRRWRVSPRTVKIRYNKAKARINALNSQ